MEAKNDGDYIYFLFLEAVDGSTYTMIHAFRPHIRFRRSLPPTSLEDYPVLISRRHIIFKGKFEDEPQREKLRLQALHHANRPECRNSSYGCLLTSFSILIMPWTRCFFSLTGRSQAAEVMWSETPGLCCALHIFHHFHSFPLCLVFSIVNFLVVLVIIFLSIHDELCKYRHI